MNKKIMFTLTMFVVLFAHYSFGMNKNNEIIKLNDQDYICYLGKLRGLSLMATKYKKNYSIECRSLEQDIHGSLVERKLAEIYYFLLRDKYRAQQILKKNE